MYDQSLEQLIDAVIADGVITDQERKVVYKKAAALGIDQDEIEVYLDGRLAADGNKNVPKSGKHGVVKTCPNCGAPVKSGSAKCEECGFLFTNVEANSSASKLYNEIMKISSKSGDEEEKLTKISSAITNFPVPTSREDILEFISMAIPNTKKKGNFINLYPALSGIIISLLLIVLISAFLGAQSEAGDKAEEAVAAVFIVFMVGGWIVPLVVGAIMHFSMRNKAKEMRRHNVLAKAWTSKAKQVIMKARFAMKDDAETMSMLSKYERKLS